MSGWTALATLEELEVGAIRPAKLGELEVVVCRTNAGVSVLERRCLHAGADLADGLIVGPDLICPLHGWCYRAATGVHVQSPGNRLTSFAVLIKDGVVFANPTPIERT